MSLLLAEDDKEIARINELERLAKLKREKLNKNATRQKILLGSFLLDMVEHNKLAGVQEYVANNLDTFLTREDEKKLMKPMIENVKKKLGKQAAGIVSENSDLFGMENPQEGQDMKGGV
jgi:hypothetical protein